MYYTITEPIQEVNLIDIKTKTLKSYKNSGALGDLIYSLIIPARADEPCLFKVAINNLMNECKKQGYNTNRSYVGEQHYFCFTEEQYDFIKPLLQVQPYIMMVDKWYPSNPTPVDVDLDEFRTLLFKRFEGNYLEAFYKTHNVAYTDQDVHGFRWLTVNKKQEIAPIVVCRTPRYNDPNGHIHHKELAEKGNFDKQAIFIGTEQEHKAYQEVIGMKIQHHKIKDALEFAEVVDGSTMFISNQTFGFSLAMGLGKNAILETIKTKPLDFNECYFKRPNVQYF